MNELFGGMFDFNGDGVTDPVEMALGFAIMDEFDKDASDDNNENNA